MARNVQHILKLESHFDWVSDPAAGSYFIEKLTSKLLENMEV
jgi:methylmalonyl-CoA mutase